MIKTVIIIGLTALLTWGGTSQFEEFPNLSGPYLGQMPPGMTAVIFAPGLVSTEANEVLIGFFHDGAACLFERSEPGFGPDWIYIPIYLMRQEKGFWTKPVKASLKGKPWYHAYPDAPAGTAVFFAWKKNLNGEGPTRDIDIWKTTREITGWSEPWNLGSPVNTDGIDGWPSWTRGQILYFFSTRAGGCGRADLYRSRPILGRYSEAENLGPAVNSASADHDPFIAPDESVLILCSDRPGGFGGNDLYISFRRQDGTWSAAVNMGDRLNSASDETRPSVTADGKYLFFNRTQAETRDIYWVSAAIIDALRPKG